MVNYIRFFIVVSLFIPCNIWALSLPDTQEAVHLSVSSTSMDEKRSLDLQLYQALKDGSVKDVQRLLAQGASPDHHSSLRAAPLYYAAYYGHLECAKTLLDSGAHWNVPYARWFTPHLIAFLEGHTEVATLFAACGSVLKDDDAHGWTPLHRAAFFGDDERVVALVPQGFLVDAVTIQGETPLHAAAHGGSISCVNRLLAMKADCMARQKNGSTLLHCASEGGLLPLIGFCLEKGFNLHEADEKGWQPIHCAARYGSSEAVRFLLINGADGNAKTIYGATPVHLAASHEDVQSMQALVERGAQLDVLSGKKRTPLHHAASSNSVACAQFCLSNGIDMEAEDIQGRRALEMAAHNGSYEVLTTLLKRGSTQKKTLLSSITNFFQPEYRSTLRLAVDGGHASCVDALLDAGGALYQEGLFKGTPLEAAMAYGSESVLKEFVKRLHRLYDSSTQEKQESCLRVAEFLQVINNYKQKYPSLAGLTMDNLVQILTALPETERDFVRAILHTLRESERAVYPEDEKVIINPLETEDDVALLLTLNSTREAVKRASCEVLQDLFRRFHENNTSEQYSPYYPLKLITKERRALLDPTQVEKNFGQAVRQGTDEWITFLADPTQMSKGYKCTIYGYTPLHFAAQRSSADVVRSLLKQGFSVDVGTKGGVTPLHLAALNGKLENMHLLKEAGASMEAKTNRGTTVLQCAAQGGSVSCVKFCLDGGNVCEERNNNGWRALHFASRGGSASVIKFLRSEGDKMNEPSDIWSQWFLTQGLASPLMLAIKSGHASCAKTLLDGGADPQQVEGTKIPLEYALKYGSQEILEVFVKSIYRRFYPLKDKVEEARQAIYSWFIQHKETGNPLCAEDVLPLLHDDILCVYCVRALLSELNTKVQYSSPAFNNFSAYELKRIFETPEVVDAVTTNIMKHFKALCKKLCDTDVANKEQDQYVCMTAERRALLDPATLDKTFRQMVRTALEKRFTKLTRRLRGSAPTESSDEGTVGTKRHQLVKAVKNGLLHDVVRLLHEGISPDEKVAGHVAALPYAVYYGHKECAQTLMSAGANWKAPFLLDCTPHKLAVLQNNVELAELFSAQGSSVEATDYSDWHALHWASFFGDDEMVRTLVAQGVKPDCPTNEGITPLHLAARGGSHTCVDYLIEQGANIMARQNDGLTLLHCAAEGSLTSLVDRCLEKGLALIVSSGDTGWQPIHSAARYGSPNMISHLLSRGADVNAQTSEGMSPLHLAALSGNISTMRKLVEWGADCNVSSETKKSALHFAAVAGSVDCVAFCFSHGLSHNLLDNKGWRPLDHAADCGSSGVLKFLLTKEPFQANQFELPLRLSIAGNHAECVKLLLDAGANPIVGILNEETPFQWALKYGSLNIIEAFMHYSYKLFCPNDLEVGTSRVRINKALNTYRRQPQRVPSLLQEIRYLTQRETADEVARAILAFLNTNHTNILSIAGLSEEETICLLQVDDVKAIVVQYLVEQLSSVCEKLCTAHVDNAQDDNSQDMVASRRELLTRGSIQKVFGHHIRRGIDEQLARLLPTPAENKEASSSSEAPSSSDGKGIVVKLECQIF